MGRKSLMGSIVVLGVLIGLMGFKGSSESWGSSGVYKGIRCSKGYVPIVVRV